MLQFMEERWKFKFKDWEIEKEEILFRLRFFLYLCGVKS